MKFDLTSIAGLGASLVALVYYIRWALATKALEDLKIDSKRVENVAANNTIDAYVKSIEARARDAEADYEAEKARLLADPKSGPGRPGNA